MENLYTDYPPPPYEDTFEERHALGSNFPPSPMDPILVPAFLAESHGALIARRDDLAEAVRLFLTKFPTVETEDVAAAATENLAMLGKAMKMAEDQRKIAKDPFLEGCRAVDAWFAATTSVLSAAEKALNAPTKVYAQRIEIERRAAAVERARVQAREAERAAEAAREAAEQEALSADHLFATAIAAAKAAEAAQAHADAKPAAHSQIVGIYGSNSSLRQSWDVEITDAENVPDEFWVLDIAAIKRAVRAGARKIPGCRIFELNALRARG